MVGLTFRHVLNYKTRVLLWYYWLDVDVSVPLIPTTTASGEKVMMQSSSSVSNIINSWSFRAISHAWSLWSRLQLGHIMKMMEFILTVYKNLTRFIQCCKAMFVVGSGQYDSEVHFTSQNRWIRISASLSKKHVAC